ncbi:MAG: TonB-dependent receptor [Bacteroidota bacterium]
MRKFCLSLLCVLWMGQSLSGQAGGGDFETFASELRTKHNVYLYYKPEWVKDIRVNTSPDTFNVDSVLKKVLEPAGIGFIRRGQNQFFITGTTIVKKDSLSVSDSEGSKHTTDTEIIAEEYFGSFSYDNTVTKAVVGKSNGSNLSTVSVLSGRVLSESTGEPVTGATLVIEGTNKGVISNQDGEYSLSVETGSSFTLGVSCMGMTEKAFLVEMRSSGRLNIELTESLIDIQEVIVRSGKHDNVQGMQMGFQRIEMKELKSIPAVMGERDILKVANMMPGVQTTGEGSSGFNVRGSSSDNNLFLLNDIPVLNTGHLFGFFSAFNPDMIRDFNLYKSNFPVEYGGRLASVFEISTRKGNKKEFGARAALSPITGSIMMETPVVKDKSSVILAARSTYSDWILKRIEDHDISNSDASFHDIMAGLHSLSGDRASWQFFTYYSKDRFTLAGTNSFEYKNMGASLIYNRKLNNRWAMKASAVLSDYTNYHANNEQPSKAYEHEFEIRSQQLKVSISGFPALKHRVGYGMDAILHNLDQGVYRPSGRESLFAVNDFGKENAVEYALYAFDEFSVTDKLTLYGGIRYSLFNYLGPKTVYLYRENMPMELENISDTINYDNGKSIRHYSGPEYRLSFNYEIKPDLSLKFSYNRMRQYLFMLTNTVSVAPTDRWKIADQHISPPVSDQLSFGLYKNINKAALETSAEIYYKAGRDVIEYKDGADLTSSSHFETLVLQGNQDSYGAEFMIKRNAGRFAGWISYTYSRSLITVNGREPWEKINKGRVYPANYDKPHAFNFVGNIKVSRRLNLSSNVVYSTGRPITYPTGVFYVEDLQVVNYSQRNEYRLPDYFRIDLSLNIEGNLLKKKFAHGSWMFSIYNLTGRKNVYSMYFKNDNGQIKGFKQSIYGVPIFTVSYNIKLGNYAVE